MIDNFDINRKNWWVTYIKGKYLKTLKTKLKILAQLLERLPCIMAIDVRASVATDQHRKKQVLIISLTNASQQVRVSRLFIICSYKRCPILQWMWHAKKSSLLNCHARGVYVRKPISELSIFFRIRYNESWIRYNELYLL